jgi:hypothetical protein
MIMKKCYLGLIALLFAAGLQAQLAKGTRLIGGQILMASTTTELANNRSQVNTQFNFRLSAGWAYKENAVFGFLVGIAPTRVRNKRPGADSVSLRGTEGTIGLFGRKYAGLGKKFFFFTETSFSGFSGQIKDNIGTNLTVTNTRNGFALDLTPGLAYQMAKKLHLEITVPRILSASYISTVTDKSNLLGNRIRNNSLSLFSSLGNNGAVLGDMGVAVRWVF